MWGLKLIYTTAARSPLNNTPHKTDRWAEKCDSYLAQWSFPVDLSRSYVTPLPPLARHSPISTRDRPVIRSSPTDAAPKKHEPLDMPELISGSINLTRGPFQICCWR